MNEEHASEAPAPVEITIPYLQVTFIPCFVDTEGSLWLEQGWHHDLIEHLVYLRDFTLCAPKARKTDQPNLKPIVVPHGTRFRFVELPRRASALQALLSLPRTLLVLWRAIGQAEVVHSSVIGWPYPLGWIVNPFAVIRRKALVLVVESSWRSDSRSPFARTLNSVKEWAARWACSRATVALFTQSKYREALHRGDPTRAYITPAVWINEADLLRKTEAQLCWERKNAKPVSMLFAGRIVAAKGVAVLLQALMLLDQRRVEVQVDVIGEGALRADCLRLASQLTTVHLSVLDPVPYGPPFFALVGTYHVVLIPSLSDEQPRIVFDANAQAVPVIASDTPGLRPHVLDHKTGWLIEPGNPEALAAAIEKAILDRQHLGSMGMAALAATQGHTHVAMHRERARILQKHLASF